jgi:hypothetical protein
MTTNHHTDIAIGAAANAVILNNPLGELDAVLTDIVLYGGGGINASVAVLTAWAESGSYEVTTATYDADNVITTATVKWPDGSTGTFTTTSKGLEWLSVDAYTVTHMTSSQTVTQTTITRDSNGNIIVKPELTVT